MSNLDIRVMTPENLDVAVEWAAAEGWNPGLDDAAAFLSADPNGFLMGFVDDEPAACISVVKYGDGFGFLGFYICRPEFRGQGFGLQVWQAGMQYLDGRTVGLDGVVDQQDNYRKSGFVLAHNNIRFGGEVSDASQASSNVRPIEATDIPELLEFDAPFFPDDRRSFMAAWLGGSENRSGMVSRRDGEIEGFGVARTCREGTKIGPLFANSEEIADDLFCSMTARCRAGPVYLDVPETNPAAIALAERHGLAPVFETARMYKGSAPALPVERTFGITTFELG